MFSLIKKFSATTWLILILIVLALFLGFISALLKKKPSRQPPSPMPSPTSSAEIFISPLPWISPSPFPTASPSLSDLDQQIKMEDIDDPAIGEELRKIYRQRPWLEKLPLKSKSYIIIFDWAKESIRVRMMIDTDSSLSREAQIAKIKTEAPKQLAEIGVDLNKEKIYYTFTP